MGWTEHLALPEAEPEVAENLYLVPREPEQADDGLLHPRPRDIVFADAPRGAVPSLAERSRVTGDSITSLRGMQVAGALSLTILCWYLAIRGLLGDGSQTVGVLVALGVLVPVAARVATQLQLRNEFWRQWCASRGFVPGERPAELLPPDLGRSPLFGPVESRVIELAGRRHLNGRDAVVGCLLRILPAPGDDGERRTASMHRASFVAMPIPETAAARWPGASIRADHHARRPLQHRAMLGSLVASGMPDARSHVTAVEAQDPQLLHRVVDARLDQYLADHPLDADVIGDMLVVTRDGAPTDADFLDDLCRDALLLHELLVAEHELPAEVAEPGVGAVAMPEEQPVIELSREGWGEQVQEWGEESLAA